VIPALILVACGLLVLWWAGARRRSAGLPDGRMVYMDTAGLDRHPTPLYDPALQLTGRPDYLIEAGKERIPVEIKSARAPVVPYRGHVLQVAAYCYLTQSVFGVRPTHGILKYQDRSLAVDYTESLEHELLDLLAEMQRQKGLELNRSHQSLGRCRACGYRDDCEQTLA
jgi:CRISPR-associated exonuclease Cas4